MQFTIPDSGGTAEADRFVEYNTCHAPNSGRFCSGGGGPDAFGFSQGKGGRRSGGRAATGRRADISAEWRSAMADAGLRTDRPGRVKGKDLYLGGKVNYGGQMVTRAEVMKDLQRQGQPQKMIDRYMQGLDRSQQREWIDNSPGATTAHRGFTIRKQSDGSFIASNPKYRAARPVGATLGDIKTQINMFQTGVRNARARNKEATREKRMLQRAFRGYGKK